MQSRSSTKKNWDNLSEGDGEGQSERLSVQQRVGCGSDKQDDELQGDSDDQSEDDGGGRAPGQVYGRFSEL